MNGHRHFSLGIGLSVFFLAGALAAQTATPIATRTAAPVKTPPAVKTPAKHLTAQKSPSLETSTYDPDLYYAKLNTSLSPMLSFKTPPPGAHDKTWKAVGASMGAACLGMGIYEGAHWFKKGK